MKLKKIGTCKVLRKFFANASEIELPFFVSDLYPFRDVGIQLDGVTSNRDDPNIDWEGHIPQKEQTQIESILEKRILRKIGNKTF